MKRYQNAWNFSFSAVFICFSGLRNGIPYLRNSFLYVIKSTNLGIK